MHPQVSPDESLSLEDFTCRSVSISFVVVNKFGVSQESPPLTLTVPGGGSCVWVWNFLLYQSNHRSDCGQSTNKCPGGTRGRQKTWRLWTCSAHNILESP